MRVRYSGVRKVMLCLVIGAAAMFVTPALAGDECPVDPETNETITPASDAGLDGLIDKAYRRFSPKRRYGGGWVEYPECESVVMHFAIVDLTQDEEAMIRSWGSPGLAAEAYRVKYSQRDLERFSHRLGDLFDEYEVINYTAHDEVENKITVGITRPDDEIEGAVAELIPRDAFRIVVDDTQAVAMTGRPPKPRDSGDKTRFVVMGVSALLIAAVGLGWSRRSRARVARS